ncbi:MAG: chromosome segregation ATPase [Dinoroseobacter sp.]|jgi:chromosome segregation ATPase
MSELGELEKRIAEALERIRTGVEGLSAAPAEDVVSAAEADALAEQLSLVTADLAEATDALAAERTKISGQAAQITEQSGQIGALNAQINGLRSDAARHAAQDDEMDAAQAELRTVRASVQELQTANAELRRSALSGVTNPELINRSLAADLEAVQAARLSELRDLDAVLRVLTPVLEEPSNA